MMPTKEQAMPIVKRAGLAFAFLLLLGVGFCSLSDRPEPEPAPVEEVEQPADTAETGDRVGDVEPDTTG